MALVFQYGSNMSVARLNGEDRLAGDAKVVCVAKTVERFEFIFSVWSTSNKCAAADLLPSYAGRSVYGVLYEIPDFLLSRDTAKERGRKSLDAIEGEGTNYVRTMIDVVTNYGATVPAMTYVVKIRQTDLKTSAAYVSHILAGLRENNMPEEYCKYVRAKILESNAELIDAMLLPTPDA
ncbi:MAG: gamma-glutamylcyclotransferase [Hydrogenophaga sp.]|jgi:cation transport regulator ChaC|nr:gamma-glutamylcyclotransferase [Hydrogenophaga sp.]